MKNSTERSSSGNGHSATRSSIAAYWEIYLLQVVPADASANQVTETRRAFYVGAAAMYELLLAFDDDKCDDKAVLAAMERLANELRQFGADVKTGKK